MTTEDSPEQQPAGVDRRALALGQTAGGALAAAGRDPARHDFTLAARSPAAGPANWHSALEVAGA
jgi:hypothetical protein